MRIWKWALAVSGCLMLVVSSAGPVAATSNFAGVYHTPKVLLLDQALTAYVQFTDTSKIKSVMMHFCKLKPGLICYMPIDMTSAGSGWYKGTTGTMKSYSIAAGSVGGFNVTVTYTDSTSDEIPHVPNEFSNMTVENPVTGSYYFPVPIVDKLPTSNVLSVYNVPNKIDYEKSIVAYVKLNDYSKVKDLTLKLCQLEPTYKCYFPGIGMSSVSSGLYKASTNTMKSYGITGAGKGGYNITLNYTDGTSDTIPHVPNEFSNMTVVDAQGTSFFAFTIENPPSAPKSWLPAPGVVPLLISMAVAAVVVAFLLSRRRKNA